MNRRDLALLLLGIGILTLPAYGIVIILIAEVFTHLIPWMLETAYFFIILFSIISFASSILFRILEPFVNT